MAAKKAPSVSASLKRAGRAAAKVYEDGSVKGRVVGGKVPAPGKVVARATGRATSGARAMSQSAKARRR